MYFPFFYRRTAQNNSERVLKQCMEIADTLPKKVMPQFEKGKHLSINEVFPLLQEKLGNRKCSPENFHPALNCVFSIKADKYYTNSAFITILQQEIARYDALLDIIHQSVVGLMRSLKGETMISKTLEDIAESLVVHKVPAEWEVHMKKKKRIDTILILEFNKTVLLLSDMLIHQ
jgi:hypothetical protein